MASCEGWPGIGIAARMLKQGGCALDAVEAGIRMVEDDERVRSVGRGGTPDVLGRMALDAAIMDGATLLAGAVACLEGYRHPISVARKVMERLPHVMLVGKGAARFATEISAERRELLTERAKQAYERWLVSRFGSRQAIGRKELSGLCWLAAAEIVTKGTVVYLAMDRDGNIAAGTSTSGWAYRYPGRVGDSPIVGAGLYADNRYGACGCTHVGEMTIRVCTARSVVLYMKAGASVEEACLEALRDLAGLKFGFTGPVMIHAMDSQGRVCVAANQRMRSRYDAYLWTPAEGRQRLKPLTRQ